MSYQPKHSTGSYSEWESRQIREDRIREVAARKHAAILRDFDKYSCELRVMLAEIGEGEHERISNVMAFYIQQAFRASNDAERKQAYSEIGAHLYEHVSEQIWNESLNEATSEADDECTG